MLRRVFEDRPLDFQNAGRSLQLLKLQCGEAAKDALCAAVTIVYDCLGPKKQDPTISNAHL